MKINNPRGSTPIEPEDLLELVPSLSTQGELNEFEARNIQHAEAWARSSSRLRGDLLSVRGLLDLHRQMFGETWKWAGAYRNRVTNIGIDPSLIREELPALCSNAAYWIENRTFPWAEIAVNFHHKLVFIHPFKNGNGRHSRLAADLLLEFNGESRLPWGGGPLIEESARRTEYVEALHEADRGDIARLSRFAQSS